MRNKNIYLNTVKSGFNGRSLKPLILLVGPIFLFVILIFSLIFGPSYKPMSQITNVIIVLTTIGLALDTLNNFTNTDKNHIN